ncbi:hypothetical protein DXG01_002905 [Tephrocybe rancida]|nr:hypothetical protein DXG01_002905 [Tephrocybe rancida]
MQGDWSKTARFVSKFLGRGSKTGATSTLGETQESEKHVVIAVVGRLGEDAKRAFVIDAIGESTTQDTNSQIHYATSRDPSNARNIVLAYATGSTKQKLTEELHLIAGWHAQSSDKRKLSGLIYLDDASTDQSPKKSRVPLDLIDRYMERSNVILATIGWDDDRPSEKLVDRQKELRDQWKSFVDRGVSVLRLSAPGKNSQDVFHTSWDLVRLLVSKADEGISTRRGAWKGRGSTADDQFLDDPMDTDIVIPIMGPTGAGKSTFINTVMGEEVSTVGHDLKSQTAQLQHFVLRHPKDKTRRIIIVDTPGFDDTYVADSEILRRIAVWLARSYSANMKLAGVIYLHEISQTRMLGTARKNLDMFNKLIGEDATKSIVLATTKWSEVPEDVGERREEQLRERHWKWMFDLGAKLDRFTGTPDSGWKLLHLILDQANLDVNALEIQQELVEIQKILPDTQAGQTLRYTLEELLETQRIAAAQLRTDEDSAEVKKMMQETDKIIRATTKQIDELSGPLAHRLGIWMRRVSILRRVTPSDSSI